jgi:hypothetical protein
MTASPKNMMKMVKADDDVILGLDSYSSYIHQHHEHELEEIKLCSTII